MLVIYDDRGALSCVFFTLCLNSLKYLFLLQFIHCLFGGCFARKKLDVENEKLLHFLLEFAYFILHILYEDTSSVQVKSFIYFTFQCEKVLSHQQQRSSRQNSILENLRRQKIKEILFALQIPIFYVTSLLIMLLILNVK